MYKLGLEKAEELEIKLPTSTGSFKNQEFQKNIYFLFIDYAKAFVWITTNMQSVSSVAQSCPILWDPMDCSMPDYLVHHQFPDLTQTHVPRVGDAIQPSHPLLSLSPPDFNLSQHQCLLK